MDAPPLIAPRLTVNRLFLRYAESARATLDGLDFSVFPGEVVAILGRSGSGKTSLLRALAAFARPESGTVTLDGKTVIRDGELLLPATELRQRVCLVFQQYSLFPNLTALGNITFAYCRRTGASASEAEAAARLLAHDFELGDEVLDRYPDSLSGGEAQRVALMRALILKPEILLLDEVTSSLDPESIVSVVEAIQKLKTTLAGRRLSVVLVTHLPHFAAEVADRILFLESGRFVVDAPAREFLQTRHAGAQAFIQKFRHTL